MGMLGRVGVLASAMLLGGCPSSAVVPPLAETLGPSWTMVPLPNTSLVPGAVVQVVQTTGTPGKAGQIDLRLLGQLSDCAVPAAALVVQNAAVPSVTSGSTYGIDASLGAKLAGVSGQLGGNVSSMANFTIGSSTDSTLDYIAFQRWATDVVNAASLSHACGQILAQSGVFVVQEAFGISSGSYTFQTKGGVSIGVTPPPNVPVQASVGANAGTTGGLTITQPVVFALKVLQPLPQGGFQVASGLGSDGPVSHDLPQPRSDTPMLATRSAIRSLTGAPPVPVPRQAAPPPAAPPSAGQSGPVGTSQPPPAPYLLAGHPIGEVQGLPGR